MIRIAICDDEPIHLNLLHQQLLILAKEQDIVVHISSFDSGEKLIQAMKQINCFDLVFLDILLQTITGIDVAKKIRETHPEVPITLISSSIDYALDGYAVNATNYLTKPYKLTQLKETLLKMLHEVNKIKRQTFYYKTSQSISTLPIQQILYFESNRRIITLYTITGEVIDFYGKLNEIEESLTENYFIRSHRSYLINPSYIKDIDSSCITLTTDKILPVSRSQYTKVKEKFIHYLTSS